MLIPLILALYYGYRYFDNENPPIWDFISPLITLFILWSNLHDRTLQVIIIHASLFLDSCADYLMNTKKLHYPMMIFSIAHMVKQFSFLIVYPSYFSSAIFLLTILILIYYCKKLDMLVYAFILALSSINITMMCGKINFSYFLFIISDLIILVDLKVYRFEYRQIRIILVPILYWLSQYLIYKN